MPRSPSKGRRSFGHGLSVTTLNETAELGRRVHQLQVDHETYSPISPPDTANPVYIGREARQLLRMELFGPASHTGQKAAEGHATSATLGLGLIQNDFRGIDIGAAIVILQELKKTATTNDLVALHRALLPETFIVQNTQSPTQAPALQQLTRSARSYHGEIHRRRSLFVPGEATRTGQKQSSDSKEVVHAEVSILQPSTLSIPAALLRPVAPIDRTATPSDFEPSYLGAMKLGSLRITNGAASPQPSVQCMQSMAESTVANDDEYCTASEGSEKGNIEVEEDRLPGKEDNVDGGRTTTNAAQCEQLNEQHVTQGFAATNEVSLHELQEDECPTEASKPRESIHSYSTYPATSPGADEMYLGGLQGGSFFRSHLEMQVNARALVDADRTWTEKAVDTYPEIPSHSLSVAQKRQSDVSSRSHANQLDCTAGGEELFPISATQTVQAAEEPIRDSGYGSVASRRNSHESTFSNSTVEEHETLTICGCDQWKEEETALLYQEDVNKERSLPALPPVALAPPRPSTPSLHDEITPAEHITPPSTPKHHSSSAQQARSEQARKVSSKFFGLSPTKDDSARPQRKLQKRRPVSDRFLTDKIIVQRVRSVKGAPAVPHEIEARHAMRIETNPGMDSLKTTYKSVAHSGSPDTLLSPEPFFDVEYRFPSPAPGSDSQARGRQSRKSSFGCIPAASRLFRSRSRKSRDRRFENSPIVFQDDVFSISAAALDRMAASMGPSHYELGHAALRHSDHHSRNTPELPRILTHTQRTSRPKSFVGMSSEEATALALTRSRDRLANMDGSDKRSCLPARVYPRRGDSVGKRDSFENIPGARSRPSSFASDAPPVPALPAAPGITGSRSAGTNTC